MTLNVTQLHGREKTCCQATGCCCVFDTRRFGNGFAGALEGWRWWDLGRVRGKWFFHTARQPLHFPRELRHRSSDQGGHLRLPTPSCFSGYSDQFWLNRVLDRKQSTHLSSTLSRNYQPMIKKIYDKYIWLHYFYPEPFCLVGKSVISSQSATHRKFKYLRNPVNNSPND